MQVAGRCEPEIDGTKKSTALAGLVDVALQQPASLDWRERGGWKALGHAGIITRFITDLVSCNATLHTVGAPN